MGWALLCFLSVTSVNSHASPPPQGHKNPACGGRARYASHHYASRALQKPQATPFYLCSANSLRGWSSISLVALPARKATLSLS